MHRTPAEPSDAAPWAPPAGVRGSPVRAGDVQDTLASVPAPDARDAGTPLGEAPGDGADRSDLDRLARALKQAGIRGNTQKIYRSRFALFVPWCAARGVPAMPVSPELLWQYLVALADENKSVSTVKVSLAAINKAHQVFGHTPPRSEQIGAMIRKLERTADRPKAIDLATLKTIVAGCPHDVAGTRDRALLLGTYHGRLRRAQSAALDLEDVQRETDRYLVRVSKGGKEGARVGLSSQPDLDLCPVHAMDEWLLLRSKLAPGADPSALFVALHSGRRGSPPKIGQRISPEDVDRIFKRRAMASGLDPANVSATDLRADGCAEAARFDDPIRGLKCE
jgi:site-specific recombinase XerD